MVLPVVNPNDESGAASYVSWLLNELRTGQRCRLLSRSPEDYGTYAEVRNPLFALGWLEIKTTLHSQTQNSSLQLWSRYDVPVSKVATVQQASMDKLFRLKCDGPYFNKGKEKMTTFVIDQAASHSVWRALNLHVLGNAITWPESTEYFIPSNDFIGIVRTVRDKAHMMEIAALSHIYLLTTKQKENTARMLGFERRAV
ncbi:uncharacterized protein PADG_04480 [Paracoccidioides brasiliensis Pb18]|uniref:Uncharacterized protein n=1 Tax=Paracoccidioides brasiliensis (strain Pb18) TaxID=502780 RepID=C1GBV8_PARBD|nr:uncharacterized protein PADG_04480 [Paracoccidioides brasiliensis Pb18]EEH48401.2 hypothetical protein PADG_04480 [Paracoccidioides brasiliensis Pb18]ODH46626.1 hypothetical protein GX48_07280 [Paracoccidioides brasiliensis]